MRVENKIIQNLLFNEEYCRKAAPHIKLEYFKERTDRAIVKVIMEFFLKYNKVPTPDVVKLELDKEKISDKELSVSYELVDSLKSDDTPIEYNIEMTEKFCQDSALYNAILKSIAIIDGKDKEFTQEALPGILQDALSVSFDTNIGHDYVEDADARYDFYKRVEEKVPFDLDILNNITSGGLSKKSLNIILSPTGAGKTLVKCHIAAATLKQSKNVLYITMEMAEERIAERIDANLMNVTLDELKVIDRETFSNRFDKIRKKTQGRLIIKEYPTATAHSGHFRALLEELRIKKNFIPDLIIIDYLNICASARMRMGASVNSYTYIKSIAEELRGLAVEYNVPILSSTQTNRDGYANSDVDLSNVSESAGLSSTADLVIAVIRTEELDELNQLMVKQLKNRYNDLTKNKRFVLGVERSKMKLYEVEDSAQTLADSGTQEECGASWKGNIKTRASFGDFKY